MVYRPHWFVEVSWYILDWTSDFGSKGCGFDSCQCLALFVFQQDILSTLLLSIQVYNLVPGRMRNYLSLDVHAPEVAPCQNATQELRRCTMSAGIMLNPVIGVIIHCKALWVVSHSRKALYKNQLLLLSLSVKILTHWRWFNFAITCTFPIVPSPSILRTSLQWVNMWVRLFRMLFQTLSNPSCKIYCRNVLMCSFCVCITGSGWRAQFANRAVNPQRE